MRRPRGFRKACARAARGSLREKDLAWAESQTIPRGSDRKASRVASRTGPAQHLGSDAARSILEVRRAAADRRREAGLVCAEGQQFFRAAGERPAERNCMEGG